MVQETAAGAHSVLEVIQPAIILLGLGIIAALGAKICRLNPIVGYIVLGLGLSFAGYAEMFEGSVVEALAEAGVMFLLFNLGLHFSIARIREEASNIFGFGSLQMLIAGGGFTGLGLLLGLPPVAAILGGFAMGLSSTAVVIGVIKERDQEDCPVGRAAQSILIFQDIAAIMLLVVAGSLGTGDALGVSLGIALVKAIAAFGVAVLFARYLTEPLFRIVTRIDSSEVLTATALFLALAAGWVTGLIGLSLTLGAFLGGVALADSRYRLLVQTEIEAFRGLFLGFFFMTVGLSLDPDVIRGDWHLILAATLALVALKCLFNILAGLANRWSVPGSIQLGFLLGQGSEFALVLFSLPAVAALFGAKALAIVVSAIALSLALTPAISNIGRKLAGKLRRGPTDEKLAGDNAPILLITLGETGRKVADMLGEAEIDYLAIEYDRERFEQALADGYPVHFAPVGDPRSWQALGVAKRQGVVVAQGSMERVLEIGPLIRDHAPEITRIIGIHGMAEYPEIEDDRTVFIDIAEAGGAEAIFAEVLTLLSLQDAGDQAGLAA
ncbi:monovalent cation:proton antiporter-2 (CPA2) family protein [Pontixanthobacter gangjinensis]|uniref:Potassium transporter KefB n=1 Tax=Pontixanthobacter gangjinensis TaxID=1028742 RepID=A0A6I4SSH0_9SPHN|nr:cation:proton antiporter [Pontixanthobacter gangjinensis]MXO57916.1 potassium transporter KefB [Pontixanthobacter gangjinensis]